MGKESWILSNQTTVMVMDATKELLFEQLPFLVETMGYPLKDQSFAVRTIETIDSPEDIQSGDTVSYLGNDGKFWVLGYDLSDVDFERLVAHFIVVTGLEKKIPADQPLNVLIANLSEPTGTNKSSFDENVNEMKETRDKTEVLMSSLLLVHATTDQMMNLMADERLPAGEEWFLTMYDKNHPERGFNDVGSNSTPIKLSEGCMLMGSIVQNNTNGQTVIVACGVSPDDMVALSQVVFQSFYVGLPAEDYEITIEETTFEDFSLIGLPV